MIVIVGNTKGGTGKTTLAVQIALSRQIAGRAVLLIDADRQGSAQNAATMRAEAGRMPPLACVQLADGRQLRAQLSRWRASMTTPSSTRAAETTRLSGSPCCALISWSCRYSRARWTCGHSLTSPN
jgi:anion-transporting  ArsA/GET3 family ATPase